MKKTVVDNMMALQLLYVVFVAIAATQALENKYCSMNCEYEDNLTFVHTVCARGKEV